MRSNALLLGLTLSVTIVRAQAPLNAIGSPTLIDLSTTVPGVNQGAFAALNPAGSSTPTDGQLDYDGWNYTADAAPSTAAQGAANFPGAVPGGNGVAVDGSLTSGISAVDINGNRALAIQPAATHWTAGSITLRAQNNTVGSMEQLDVSYTLYVFNDAGRSNDVRFYYSLSAAQNSWVEVASAAVISAEAADAVPAWVANQRTFSISGFSINPGDVVYMRWVGNDVSGTGTRDEFALDDISLTPQTATGPLLISSETALQPFAQTQGSPSTEQGFVLFGANLTDGALVTAPAPFEVSLTTGTGFAASLSVPHVSGSISPTPVYVRLNSASTGTFSGAITITSTGAGDALVGVSGTTTGTSGLAEATVEPIKAWPSIVVDQINVSVPFTGQVITSDGAVAMQVSRTMRVDVSALGAGSYVLRAVDGRVFRFVKVD